VCVYMCVCVLSSTCSCVISASGVWLYRSLSLYRAPQIKPSTKVQTALQESFVAVVGRGWCTCGGLLYIAVSVPVLVVVLLLYCEGIAPEIEHLT
jgi:hypothetical protein